jgi:very-short-patch-repair endonuclease
MRTTEDWRALLARQARVVSARQAAGFGFTRHAVAAQLGAMRWQRVAPRVYATYSGPLAEPSQEWAALLYAGPGALLSHATSAAVWGLRPREDGPVDVVIPNGRKARTQVPLVRIHRSRLDADPVCAERDPPRTSVEATVFDLAGSLGDQLTLLARAMQLRLTTEPRLLAELDRRRTQRWRPLLREALGGVAEGAESVLELRYLRDVERAHGLPPGERQRSADSTFQDVYYPGFRLVVELDGRLGHADPGSAWRDMARDNRSALRSETTLRYGWADVTGRRCAVARQIASLLRDRGWTGPTDPSECEFCNGL